MTPNSKPGPKSSRMHQFEEFFIDSQRVLGTPGTKPEISLYGQFEKYLQASFTRLGHSVQISQQAGSEEGVPDYRVERNGELLGWIELKALLGKDLDRLEGHDKDQQDRFTSGLSNVLYSTGWQWRLFQNAEQIGNQVNLGDKKLFDPNSLNYPPSEAQLDELDSVLQAFLTYASPPFRTPSEAVAALAVRAKGLKLALLASGEENAGSHLGQLYHDFGSQLFKNGTFFTWEKFVDSYVQIATFGVLLWRLEARAEISLDSQVNLSRGSHPLLYQALTILWSHDARLPILEPLLENLARTANLIQPDLFESSPGSDGQHSVPDPILHAYEPFFAEYDRAAREANGVYYTPPDVVSHIVSGIDSLLRLSLHKPDGVLDENTKFLDPATGTGTFLLGLANEVARRAKTSGLPVDQMVDQVLTHQTAAFELFPGPYVIAHQRLESSIKGLGGISGNRLPIYLTDTLAAPAQGTLGGSGFGVVGEEIIEERQRADRVKVEEDLLVLFGNPPWDRLKAGNSVLDHFALLLLDILREATPSDQRANLKSTRDLYVAFWLWSLWALQSPAQRAASSAVPRIAPRDSSGMIAFITNRTWIHGKSLVGLRDLIRAGAKEVWITDLGGDGRGSFGARSFAGGDQNVFEIQTGAAIAWVIFGTAEDETCDIRYRRIFGTRQAKFEELRKPFDAKMFVHVTESQSGTMVASAWKSSTLKNSPTIADLFAADPLTGIQTARDTSAYSPIAVDASSIYHSVPGRGGRGGSAGRANFAGGALGEWAQIKGLQSRYQAWATAQERRSKKSPPDPEGLSSSKIRRFLYRPLDWRHVYDDPSWITWYREDLHALYKEERRVPALVTILDNHGRGPLVMHTSTLMDQHSFRGSAGGKGVFPLYVVAGGQRNEDSPSELSCNFSSVAIEWLQSINRADNLQDAYAYILAVLSAPSYAARHWQALTSDSPRVPLTNNGAQFDRIAKLGKQLIESWELAIPPNPALAWEGSSAEELLGEASWRAGVIYFSSGRRISGVTEAMWRFEISGYRILPNWFKARSDWKVTAGRAKEAQRTLSAVERLVSLCDVLDLEFSTLTGPDDL